MRSFALLLIGCWCTLLVHAQGGGIDGDFGKLSAKERSRIAREEEERSGSDARFQAVMQQAEDLFRSGQYEEALERFTEARDLRPYNVYPRVKIQDLQALIARRDAELERQQAEVEEARPEPPSPVGTPSAVAPQVEPDPMPAREERQLPLGTEPTPRPIPREQVERRMPVPEERPKPQEGERIYKEGRAVVTERTVTIDDRPTVFRRVAHPWGEVMFFRDGMAIPERVWNEAFGQR